MTLLRSIDWHHPIVARLILVGIIGAALGFHLAGIQKDLPFRDIDEGFL